MPPKAQRSKLHVIKIPLEYTPVIHPPAFPPMPRLYMELLENKAKVKPEVRNKEYVDNSGESSLPSLAEAETKTPMEPIIEEDRKDEVKTVSLDEVKGAKKGKKLQILDLSTMSSDDINKLNIKTKGDSKIDFSSFRGEPSLDVKYRKSGSVKDEKDVVIGGKNDRKDENVSKDRASSSRDKDRYGDSKGKYKENEDRRGNDRKSDDYGYDRREKRDSKDDRYRDDKYRDDEKNKDIRYKDDDREDRHRDDKYDDKYDDKRKDDRHRENKDDKYKDEQRDDKYKNDKHDDNISEIISPTTAISLEDLLSGKDVDNSQKESYSSEPTVHSTQNSSQTVPKVAPSLAEISSGKVQRDANGVRDMAYVTKDEENDLSRKRDILFKFKILKRTYKEANVPEYTEFTDLKTLEREYDSVVRQLSLDATVENYKKYLTIGFFILEFVLSTFFKIEDIKGFTQQQLLGLNQYERILWEIGEKSYFANQKQWSPEIRLIGMIILNGAVFIGTKMLFRATGANLMGMLNNATQSMQQPQNINNKPKMKGPDLDLSQMSYKKSS